MSIMPNMGISSLITFDTIQREKILTYRENWPVDLLHYIAVQWTRTFLTKLMHASHFVKVVFAIKEQFECFE